MVTYAPNTQSYLYNHMSSFIDYCTDKDPEMCINKGSIYDFINSNPKFSKFRKIVDIANRMGFLNEEQAVCTVFIPSNDYLEHIPENYFDTMDRGLAQDILSASIIPKKLASDLLTSSPVCYLYTKNPKMRMYVTNINNRTTLNNCAVVVQYDIWCNNGIIHLVDNLIEPSQEHFMN